MPSPKKLLVLDLGMQGLRLAEFVASKEGQLTLLRGARREFMLDPTMDTSRPDQIRIAVQEIQKEWGLKKGDVSIVLPAHAVFTKVAPLDIPGGQGGQVDAVVTFEAQQNIPFPLEEVVWDYAVMGETPSGAVNVVFVAIKTDQLESICAAVSSSGLNIVSVSAAPLALYDALRVTYPDTASSTILLLDVGSRTTNMVVAGPDSFFSRSIPSGGLAVTQAIAKDIHAELEEAEHLKVTRGSVALGPGFEPPSEPMEANLAKIARVALLKTQADISRSLSYYRSNLGGADPKHVLLTGGMASQPFLLEFLAEKLNKEISFFEPLGNLSAEETSESAAASFIESNPNNLGELVGGAVPLVTSTITPVDLLPPSVTKKKEFAKRLPYLAAAAAVFWVALASWYGYALNASSVTRVEISKLSMVINDESRIDSQMQDLINKASANQKTSDQLLGLIRVRSSFPSLLAELSEKMPDRFIWITEFVPAVDAPQKGSTKPADPSIKAVTIKGLYLENPRVIDDFVNKLQASDVFAVEEKEKSKIITQRGSPNEEYWAYPYALKLPLRNPINPLP